MPLNLLFLKLLFSAKVTDLRRSEGDDLCALRSQGKELLTVLHPTEKTTLKSHLLG